MAVRGSWHIAISITETMKRKAEIRFTATFVVTAELTDAKWKKLIGTYFEPDGNNWGADHPWAIEAWAEEEVSEAMRAALDDSMPSSIQLNHVAENSDGAEEFLIECIDAEDDGIEITNSL